MPPSPPHLLPRSLVLAASSDRWGVLPFPRWAQVMDALMENFALNDDVARVKEVHALYRAVTEICVARESDLREHVRALSRSVEEAEAHLASPEPEAARARRLTGLRAEAEARVVERKALEAEAEAAGAAGEELSRREEELRQMQKNLEVMASELEPRARHELSLYGHISNIKWDDYEDTGRITGVLSKPHTSELKRLELDAGSMSRFDLCNQLWAAMA